MHSDRNIKYELSVGLQDDLTRELGANERVVVSLPGSIGEALVVSDRRVIILRDSETGGQSDVYSYHLAQVNQVRVEQSGMGGFVELELADSPSNPDHARVYFPSYEIAKYEAAAQYIESVISSADAESAAEPGDPGSAACSGCGAQVSARDVFCSRCGVQILALCRLCGRANAPEAAHCTGCGSALVEFVPDCPQCSGRIQSWMSYCPECGSVLGVRCAACGMSVTPGWKHCASCGRLLGSESLEAGAARSLQQRLQQRQEVERSVRESSAAAPPVGQPGDLSKAQEHNAHGQELFENEDVQAAIGEFERAVDLDPANTVYRCNLAVAYEEAGRGAEALVEYEKALQLNPDDLTALLSLGYIHNENNDAAKAQAMWSKILVIAPNSAEAQEVRENLRHQQNL